MRRSLAAASACLVFAALAAPALAQDTPPPPPPSDDAASPPPPPPSNYPAAPPPPSADYPAPPPPAPIRPRPPADRGAGVRIGTLSCSAAGGWGLLIGSRRPISCVYLGTHGTEHYEGDLTKIGLDIGYKGKGTVVWTVIAPTTDLAPGSLSGHYGGLTAGASAVVGVSANALIGGNNNGVSLQPLSVEGNVGINASAGIGGMDLRFTGVTA